MGLTVNPIVECLIHPLTQVVLTQCLPGDIRYESDHVQVYVPIVSMLIASVVLSILFYLARRFF